MNWDKPDYSVAMRLKCICTAALEFVRKFIVPLPSNSILKHKFGPVHCQQGLLLPAYEYLRDISQKMGPKSKLAALLFDECKLDYHADYDSKTDEIIGPHNYAQQYMVRSLVDDWKLPIRLDFDSPVKKDTLEKLILKIEELGIIILVVICDQGGANRGLATALGIDQNNVSFPHPNDPNKKIFFTYDWIHLFKSMR